MDSSTETSMDTDSLSTARPLNDSDKETSLSQDTSLPPTPHTAPNDGDAEKLVSAPPLQDWTWVTGNSESLVYVGRIGVGATSAVHDVFPPFLHTLIRIGEKHSHGKGSPAHQGRLAN